MIKLLLVCLIPSMALLTWDIPGPGLATPDPGRETDNVAPGPITVPSIPVDESQTQICPDGTEISIVMGCPNPPGQECPPNQLVIITQAGDCIAVPEPFTCPDGVLAPTAEQCNDPTAPLVLPVAPTRQQQLQQSLPPATTPVTPPGPGELSAAQCAAIGCNPEDPRPPEPVEAQDPDTDDEENNNGGGDGEESSNGNEDSESGDGGDDEPTSSDENNSDEEEAEE
ncbi:MAG: hypothetical protein ACRD47_12140 [Nitrososphaeraceae archaeon]